MFLREEDYTMFVYILAEFFLNTSTQFHMDSDTKLWRSLWKKKQRRNTSKNVWTMNFTILNFNRDYKILYSFTEWNLQFLCFHFIDSSFRQLICTCSTDQEDPTLHWLITTS